jgi:hypothetical protein
MVAALQDLYARAEAVRATAEPWPDNWPEAVDSSPDKRKTFVRTNVGRDLIDEYGAGFTGPIWDIYATLYFVAGRGLVDYYATSEFYTPSGGVWSPDSRYYVFSGDAVDIYLSLYKFTLWDSDAEEKRELGQISTKEGQGGVEILNGYVLWLDEQDIAGTPGSVPALVAYNLATGERIRLLKGDVATIPKEPARDAGYYYLYDVIIVPDEPCPPALKASELYQCWNGAHAFVLAGSA